MPDLFPNPSVVLIDISTSIGGDYESFVPETGQILGLLTTPLFPGPGELLIRLPISPTAASIDLDNDGAEDPGVQIYALNVASNLINDSYLQQLEQGDGLGSYLVDVTTGPLPRAAL